MTHPNPPRQIKEGHTAGPLKAERARHPDNTGGYDWAIADQDNQIIAECFEHTGYAGGSDRQYIIQPAEANARLFVASEDLLAACIALDESAPIDSEWGYCGCCHKRVDHETDCAVILARAAIARAVQI